MASDLGQPVPYETMQPLQVALEDIDDNEPLFVRPPVSSPIPCTGHPHRDSPACKHTLSCAHCTVDTRGWLHVETAQHFTERIFIEQLLGQGTIQQSKKQTKKKKQTNKNA